jgi:hypothetical protein
MIHHVEVVVSGIGYDGHLLSCSELGMVYYYGPHFPDSSDAHNY